MLRNAKICILSEATINKGGTMKTSNDLLPWHERALLTINETSEVLGIGRNSSINLIEAGKLKSIKLAGRRLVLVESIVALIAEGSAESYEATKRLPVVHSARRGRPPRLPSVTQLEPEAI
jgi:hypothetical protein